MTHTQNTGRKKVAKYMTKCKIDIVVYGYTDILTGTIQCAAFMMRF